MDKPHIPDAPGLAWRPRRNGWAAVWLARQDIAKKGFTPSTHQIKIFTSTPTEEEETLVRATCVRLQEEMYEFGHEEPETFGGTVHDLVVSYQTDKDSPYKTMRYSSRKGIDFFAKKIDAKYGALRLSDLGARDFKQWFEDIRFPEGEDGPDRKSSAHHAISALRMMMNFGATFEIEKASRDKISECARLAMILSKQKYQNVLARNEAISYRQSEAIVAAADEAGVTSVALVQEMMRWLGMRQKDIIGEWVPIGEAGVSDVTWNGRKWLRGIKLEEISKDLILVHAMSKSRQGKILEFDLKAYPDIAARVSGIMASRSTGPLVICERTDRPWKQNHFRIVWREMADKAGVPKNLQSRDNRAGAITEAIKATNGDLDAARKLAGHSDLRTTINYSREQLETNRTTAAAVTEFRRKNKP